MFKLKAVLFLLLFFHFLFTGKALAGNTPPSLAGEAAILVDTRNGQVLYQKNMNQRVFPASTTKILTAILALEKGGLEDIVTTPDEACRVEGSAVGLQTGERLTLNDLLYVLLLSSGNDAAEAIACHYGGSRENFSAMMNEKAKAVGALNSNFTNPHGLPGPNHYTTAYDLALITRYAMQNQIFREIVRTRIKKISRPDADRSIGPPQEDLWNHNRLLELYPAAIGIKTGYTNEAGQCLVAAAQKDGRELIALVFKSQGNAVYEDAKNMLEYGFTNFTSALIVKKGEKFGAAKVSSGKSGTVDVLAGSDFWYDILAGESGGLTRSVQVAEKIKAPVLAGQKIGNLIIIDQGQKVGEIDLVPALNIDKVFYKSRLFWMAGGALILFFLRSRALSSRARRLQRRGYKLGAVEYKSRSSRW